MKFRSVPECFSVLSWERPRIDFFRDDAPIVLSGLVAEIGQQAKFKPTKHLSLLKALSLEKRSCLVAPAGIDGNQFPSFSAKATELLLVPVVFHNFIFPNGSPAALNKRS